MVYNLTEKPEYIEEFILLCHKEWGNPWNNDEYEEKLQNKFKKTLNRLDKYPTLILLEDNKLIGFISLLESDCNERKNLTPWYATLYIKKEYRGKGFSKKLNDAIISEAKKRGYNKLYLKTNLINFYEKKGFIYLEKISNGESIYYKNLK